MPQNCILRNFQKRVLQITGRPPQVSETPPVPFMSPHFQITTIDHVGLRVTDRARSIAFYQSLGFAVDEAEEAPEAKATGLVNAHGARIHLIYNSLGLHEDGNVLLDHAVKLPGYTHVAFIVENLQSLLDWLAAKNILITEGPMVVGHGRRRLCFIRDPDLNVVEFNEILKP